MTNILRMTDRKNEIRGAGPGAYVKQRIADAADKLSLAGTLAARVELCNEALSKLVTLCYELDTDGLAANVDIVTYRILIPLPWGSAGWRRWGLRYHEALVLRAIMLARQGGQPAPLFVYDDGARMWCLNVMDYRGPKAAQAWLHAAPVTLAEWKAYLRQYRNGAVMVQKRYRKGSVTV